MRRREFIILLGGAAFAPIPARAQQAMPVIGYICAEAHDKNLPTRRFRAFHQGLGEAGFAEGRNVAIEYRWIEGRPDRLP